jgi:hypothetical protein
MSIANLNTISEEYFNLVNVPESQKDYVAILEKAKEFGVELAATDSGLLPFAKNDVVYESDKVPNEDYDGTYTTNEYYHLNRYYTFTKYRDCQIIFQGTLEFDLLKAVPFHLHSTLITIETDDTIRRRELNRYYKYMWNTTFYTPV